MAFQTLTCTDGLLWPSYEQALSAKTVNACLQAFDEQPHLQLLKEMLVHIFSTPKRHAKSKPFHDHVISFGVADDRLWLRNYQV